LPSGKGPGNGSGMRIPGLKLSEPMQRLLDLFQDRPEKVVPRKFLDEWNTTGQIESREEFLELAKQNLTGENDGNL